MLWRRGATGRVLLEKDESPMIIRAVLHHCKLVGLCSCGTDAAEMAKRYPGSSIVLCRLNSETAASMGIDAVATTHRSGVVDCNDCVQARCTTAFYEMLSPLGNDCAKAPVVALGSSQWVRSCFHDMARTKPRREGVGKAEPHVVRRLFTLVG